MLALGLLALRVPLSTRSRADYIPGTHNQKPAQLHSRNAGIFGSGQAFERIKPSYPSVEISAQL